MTAGVGVDLLFIQRHRAHLQDAHLARHAQNWTNSVWICLRKRLRNAVIVSWSGWSLAAMKRNATES
jgi:hypothetical protein